MNFRSSIFLIILISTIFILVKCNDNSVESKNNPPIIKEIIANPPSIEIGSYTNLACIAIDEDGDSLDYYWSCPYGYFSPYNAVGKSVRWRVDQNPGNYYCSVTVNDGKSTEKDSINIEVIQPNRPPVFPYNPIPINGATNVSINPTLSWECSDPDGDMLTYDIYFGKPNFVTLIKKDHNTKSYNPGTLENGAIYKWYIEAKDDHGNSTKPSHFNWWQFQTTN